MKKTYVLDTNILIQSPAACTCFEDNDVVLPLAVLEELDGLKRAEGDRGYSAREAIRRLEEFRLTGDLLTGVSLPGGGTLRVEGGAMFATLVWDSPNYDYMKVDGVQYLAVSNEGTSVFEVPVAALDTPLAMVADTVAMSTPHEVEYTLTFHSDSLQGVTP